MTWKTKTRRDGYFVGSVKVCLVLPALLDGVSSQKRVNDRVNGLFEVHYEDSVPCHYSLFYHIYITGTTITYKKCVSPTQLNRDI